MPLKIFRGPLFHKLVTFFAVSYRKPALTESIKRIRRFLSQFLLLFLENKFDFDGSQCLQYLGRLGEEKFEVCTSSFLLAACGWFVQPTLSFISKLFSL